jgi:hypothetical protein
MDPVEASQPMPPERENMINYYFMFTDKERVICSYLHTLALVSAVCLHAYMHLVTRGKREGFSHDDHDSIHGPEIKLRATKSRTVLYCNQIFRASPSVY